MAFNVLSDSKSLLICPEPKFSITTVLGRQTLGSDLIQDSNFKFNVHINNSKYILNPYKECSVSETF